MTFSFLMVLLPFTQATGQDVVRIATLEWPPFSSKTLEGEGLSLKLIRDAFETSGREVEYSFLPWSRALKLFASGHFDAVAPKYYDEAHLGVCHFSTAFQLSPLGFVVLKNNEITWKTLSDLKDFHIGVVNGYSNTMAFDALSEKNIIQTEPVVDDYTNIMKVAKGRIPMAVIDKNVMDYLLKTDPRLAGIEKKVSFNKQVLEEKKFFVCFQKSERGLHLKSLFDQGYHRLATGDLGR